MRDWPAIIEDHRAEGLITDKEAEDLLVMHSHVLKHGVQDEKVASLFSAIGRKGAQAKDWLLKDNSANMRARGGVAAITAMSAGGLAAAGKAVVGNRSG